MGRKGREHETSSSGAAMTGNGNGNGNEESGQRRRRGRPCRVWVCPVCKLEGHHNEVQSTRGFRIHLREDHGLHWSVCVDSLGEPRSEDHVRERVSCYQNRTRDYFLNPKAKETIAKKGK